MQTTHDSTYGWSRKILIHLSIAFDIKVDLTFHQVLKGTCLIVCALGGKKGFVEKTNLRFVGNSKSKDYHREINSAHFKEWLTQKMLPNIGDKTVIVTNNAPCRSKQTEESKKPNTSWEKKKMQD